MNLSDIEKLKEKAIKGSTPSQIQLGHSYLTGIGYDGADFPQDYSEARRWLELAHEKGAYTATLLLGSIYEKGSEVPIDVNKAISLYEDAAEQGSFLACIYLARIYAAGKGVTQSKRLASEWYKKALALEEEIDLLEEINEAQNYLEKNPKETGSGL